MLTYAGAPYECKSMWVASEVLGSGSCVQGVGVSSVCVCVWRIDWPGGRERESVEEEERGASGLA